MNLKEALEKNSPHPKACKFTKIFDTLHKDEQKILAEYMGIMSPARITAALKESGHKISEDAVERHMNWIKAKTTGNVCCCPKTQVRP